MATQETTPVLCEFCPPNPETAKRPVNYAAAYAREQAHLTLGCLKAIKCPNGGPGWHIVRRFD